MEAPAWEWVQFRTHSLRARGHIFQLHIQLLEFTSHRNSGGDYLMFEIFVEYV